MNVYSLNNFKVTMLIISKTNHEECILELSFYTPSLRFKPRASKQVACTKTRIYELTLIICMIGYPTPY